MKNRTESMTVVAFMAAVLCILGPIVVPVGIVPISLTGVGIYLAGILLGGKRAAKATLLYLFMGLAGLPVFSGFTCGAGRILGPTGGYLLGYLPAVLFCGFFCEKVREKGKTRPGRKKGILYFLICTGANLILYFFGSLWLAAVMELSMKEAVEIGVFPFLLTDLIKNMITVFLGMEIKKRTERLNYLH